MSYKRKIKRDDAVITQIFNDLAAQKEARRILSNRHFRLINWDNYNFHIIRDVYRQLCDILDKDKPYLQKPKYAIIQEIEKLYDTAN